MKFGHIYFNGFTDKKLQRKYDSCNFPYQTLFFFYLWITISYLFLENIQLLYKSTFSENPDNFHTLKLCFLVYLHGELTSRGAILV